VRRAKQLLDEHMARTAEDTEVKEFLVNATVSPGQITVDKITPITPAQLSAHMRALGSKGGKISGAKRMEMSADERRRIASLAARTRWAKKGAKKR
jgi:hypothetical protein